MAVPLLFVSNNCNITLGDLLTSNILTAQTIFHANVSEPCHVCIWISSFTSWNRLVLNGLENVNISLPYRMQLICISMLLRVTPKSFYNNPVNMKSKFCDNRIAQAVVCFLISIINRKKYNCKLDNVTQGHELRIAVICFLSGSAWNNVWNVVGHSEDHGYQIAHWFHYCSPSRN